MTFVPAWENDTRDNISKLPVPFSQHLANALTLVVFRGHI